MKETLDCNCLQLGSWVLTASPRCIEMQGTMWCEADFLVINFELGVANCVVQWNSTCVVQCRHWSFRKTLHHYWTSNRLAFWHFPHVTNLSRIQSPDCTEHKILLECKIFNVYPHVYPSLKHLIRKSYTWIIIVIIIYQISDRPSFSAFQKEVPWLLLLVITLQNANQVSLFLLLQEYVISLVPPPVLSWITALALKGARARYLKKNAKKE
jgi:hypothetical protein